MLLKQCWICEETFKSASYFYRDKSRADGLANCCKACDNRKRKSSAQRKEIKERLRLLSPERLYQVTKLVRVLEDEELMEGVIIDE